MDSLQIRTRKKESKSAMVVGSSPAGSDTSIPFQSLGALGLSTPYIVGMEILIGSVGWVSFKYTLHILFQHRHVPLIYLEGLLRGYILYI
ncbi:hypothetical protein FKM82_019893 [Ascaphus truei]